MTLVSGPGLNGCHSHSGCSRPLWGQSHAGRAVGHGAVTPEVGSGTPIPAALCSQHEVGTMYHCSIWPHQGLPYLPHLW